jgi:pyruvate dehydrogenase E1 component
VPAFVDELALLMEEGFRLMQRPDGESVYLRLTPAPSAGRAERRGLERSAVAGGYWLRSRRRGRGRDRLFGRNRSEALAAWDALKEMCRASAFLR